MLAYSSVWADTRRLSLHVPGRKKEPIDVGKKGNSGNKQRNGTASRNEVYERELTRVQVELSHLQSWVRNTGARIVVVFEGRDAAGKGGIIKRITERVSPRVFRVVALPAPTEREKTQVYIQRYVRHMPAAGEVVIFDRSWYNRPGVERVMRFCTDEEAERYLILTPRFEAYLVESGIILLKYFLTVSEQEQERRFQRRIADPLRQWKLSPMDLESYRRWWDYTRAYDEMIRRTDTPQAPWWIVPSDDKKRARINCITHLLNSVPYERLAFKNPDLGKRQKRPKDFVDDESHRNLVPDIFMR